VVSDEQKDSREKIEADGGIERGLWVKDAESENQRVPDAGGREGERARAYSRAASS